MSAFTFVGEITVFHSKMHSLALLTKGCEWKFAAIFGHSWFQLNLTKKFMGCGDSLQNVRSYDVSKNFLQHFMDVCFAKILILIKNIADRFERVCLLKSLCFKSFGQQVLNICIRYQHFHSQTPEHFFTGQSSWLVTKLEE